MAKINTYSAKGNKTTAVTAPKELVGKVNKPLLAQAIRVYKDRLHGGLSKVQTRGEITSISTRKIYKQKGTGGARHGAKSAPIFVGGGVAHGPKGVKKVLSLSSAMKKKALESALSLKLKNDRIAIVKGIGNIAKTKEASDLVLSVRKDLVSKKDSRVSIVISENSKAVVRSFRNIKNVNIYRYSDLNAYRVYFGGMILMDDAILTKKKVKTNTKT